MSNHRPDELARVLARLSRTADPAVMHEPEFKKEGFVSLPVGFLEEYLDLLKGVEYKEIHKIVRINVVEHILKEVKNER